MKKEQLKSLIKEEIHKILNENSNSEELFLLFIESINKIDENLSYKDLALTLSKILKQEYGSHNYEPFMNILKSELNK